MLPWLHVPANCRAPNLARILFFYLSVTTWIIYQYKTTFYKQIQNELAAIYNMVVGPKLSLKLGFKPKSN